MDTSPETPWTRRGNTQPQEQLLVMTRLPRPGMAKTRLIPALGEEGAARLHAELARRTAAVAATLAASRGCSVEIRYTGGPNDAARAWLPGPFRFADQGEGDLGERLKRAFADSFRQGYTRVCAIGTDCPGLTPGIIARALDRLTRAEVVLGPAHDGGYYLVGCRRFLPELLTAIPWGSGEVLAATLEKAEQLGVSHQLLPTLHDVDRPEDLRHLGDHSRP